MAKIKVGIVGGTGYTGAELLRLLARHPHVDMVAVTSRQAAGQPVADMFPNLRGVLSARFADPAQTDLTGCDAVFFATPHGAAMAQVPTLLDAGVRVIDLSADFRLRDADMWSQWYGQSHTAADLLETAVYGLPEINRSLIQQAQLVAAPGCYPTAIQLGFLPLLEAGVVDCGQLIADAKSGVSGAGRVPKQGSMLAETAESLTAYAIEGHRHLPEIEQGLQAVSSTPVSLTFVPHLAPMIRGIEATLYAPLVGDACDLQNLFETRYANEPFVDVMPAGACPQTRGVRGSNQCRLTVARPQGRQTVVVSAAIDNLVKGASGQAIQCFNLMFGLEEVCGLEYISLSP